MNRKKQHNWYEYQHVRATLTQQHMENTMSWHSYGWTDAVPRFNTFADVERCYNTTAPVVSKHHTKEQDIRPYGYRSHKHRRVIKISKNCYALATTGETTPGPWDMYIPKWYDNADADTRKKVHERVERALAVPKSDYEKYGCVVWRRHRDGSETLRIRNASFKFATGHYMSLEKILPREMDFANRRSGVHTVLFQGKALFLPISTVMSPYMQTSRGLFGAKPDGWTTREDGRHLLFRRRDGEWSVEHDCEHLREDLKPKVNRDAKHPYREAMAKFRDWSVVVYNMVGQSTGREDGLDELKDMLFAGTAASERRWWGAVRRGYGILEGRDKNTFTRRVRDIVADEDNPHRLALAKLVLLYHPVQEHSYYTYATSFDQRLQAYVNKQLNLLMGFVK